MWKQLVWLQRGRRKVQMCHRSRHHKCLTFHVGNSLRSPDCCAGRYECPRPGDECCRRRWKPPRQHVWPTSNYLAWSCDLSGLLALTSPLVCAIVTFHQDDFFLRQTMCPIHPFVTQSHLVLGIYVFSSSGTVSMRAGAKRRWRVGRNADGKRVESHPIYCQTSTTTLMQMNKLPRLWMYLKFDHISYPLTQPLPPETSHTIKKDILRPEFSPNEFLIKVYFFHIFYYLY